MEIIEIPYEETIIYLEILKLSNSAFIYISDSTRPIDNLFLLIQHNYEELPSQIEITGNSGSPPLFLNKLCRKFGQLAFSINIELPPSLYPIIEQTISKILSN